MTLPEPEEVAAALTDTVEVGEAEAEARVLWDPEAKELLLLLGEPEVKEDTEELEEEDTEAVLEPLALALREARELAELLPQDD